MEQWKAIEGFPLYEISDKGRLRRLKGYQCHKTRIVVGYVNKQNGYEGVILCRDGKLNSRYTHRLVADAFIGIPPKMTVNHKNGIKTDNRLENLEVTTLSDNMKHAYRVLGRYPDRAELIIRDPKTGRIAGIRHRVPRTSPDPYEKVPLPLVP